MKSRKIRTALVAILAAAVVFGCGSKKEASGTDEIVGSTQEAEAVQETGNQTEAAETEQAAEADTAQGELSTVDGVVIEGAMASIAIQNKEGQALHFSFPEDDSAESTLSDGIILGKVIKVTYTGSAEDGSAVVVSLADSDETLQVGQEECEFAISVMDTVEFMDMEGLASLVTYPVYVGLPDNDAVIENKEDFLALDETQIFNESLMEAVLEYPLFDLQETKAGFVMGNGKPNIIFAKGEDGTFGITGINTVE